MYLQTEPVMSALLLVEQKKINSSMVRQWFSGAAGLCNCVHKSPIVPWMQRRQQQQQLFVRACRPHCDESTVGAIVK